MANVRSGMIWLGVLMLLGTGAGWRTMSTQPAPETRAAFDAQTLPENLGHECDRMAAWAKRQLDADGAVFVCEPFVVAGNLSQQQLEDWHRACIAPAAEAMARRYFDTAPTAPITVLLMADDASYRAFSARVFGERYVSRFGYYRPHLRVVVVNAAAGAPGMLHELTHALMDFDFAAAPDWIAEGLAALNETCATADGATIRWDDLLQGTMNWRFGRLREAFNQGNLRPLADLVSNNDFHGPRQALNYAYAQSFFRYMQEQGVLESFYRRARADCLRDPTGARAVRSTFSDKSWAEIDGGFRRWLTASSCSAR